MDETPDNRTLREARSQYFEANGLPPDGGYSARWVKLKAGPIPLGFPNTQARVRAVRYHDLHHVLTGYGTGWTGESEISAWELATNCRGFLAAWVLNLWAMWTGLLFAPRAVWKAFARGRQTANLYARPFDDALLEHTVDRTRSQLGLDRELTPARIHDRMAFAAAVVAGTFAVLCLPATVTIVAFSVL